jgi:hypothetical protein
MVIATKYNHGGSEEAVEYSLWAGPCFGHNHLVISNANGDLKYNYFDFPRAYIDTTGFGPLILTGSPSFGIEVLEILPFMKD